MKKNLALGILFVFISSYGCSTGNVLSGAGGAAVGVGTYEYHLKRQRDRVESDFKSKEIGEKEYNIRMDQISRDSVF